MKNSIFNVSSISIISLNPAVITQVLSIFALGIGLRYRKERTTSVCFRPNKRTFAMLTVAGLLCYEPVDDFAGLVGRSLLRGRKS